jgi:hypothetical protein
VVGTVDGEIVNWNVGAGGETIGVTIAPSSKIPLVHVQFYGK